MSYITEPKPQSEVAQYFGEAPANGQACELTGADSSARTTTSPTRPSPTRSGTGPRRSRSAWTVAPTPRAPTTATGPRPGPRSRADPWRSRSARPRSRRALRARRPAARCHRCCGWAWPTSLALAALFITSLWSQNDFTGEIQRVWSLDNYRQIWDDPRLPDDHAPHDRDRGAGHGRGRGARVPDRALHGQGGVAAAPPAAGDRGADAAVGVVPRQGLRLARDVLARAG